MTRDVRVSYLESKTPTNNKQMGMANEIYVWGNNHMGQIGVENASDVKIPFSIKLDSIKIKMIACGQFHTALLADNGHIYMMGSNQEG